MPPSAFEDRTVALSGGPDHVSSLGSVLGSRTRLAVLLTLIRSPEPLHINEVARRVGVDASPVRTHLELLVKAGLAFETMNDVGRERRFRTTLRDIRITLEGINRVEAPEKGKEPNRAVLKVQKKLAALEADMARLETIRKRLQGELAAAWASVE